jgi:hypothetical protein
LDCADIYLKKKNSNLKDDDQAKNVKIYFSGEEKFELFKKYQESTRQLDSTPNMFTNMPILHFSRQHIYIMNIPKDFSPDNFRELVGHMRKHSGPAGYTSVGRGHHAQQKKTKECHFLSAIRILSYNSEKSVGRVTNLFPNENKFGKSSSSKDLPYADYLWDIFFNSGGWFSRGTWSNAPNSGSGGQQIPTASQLKKEIRQWKDGYVSNYDNFTKTVLLLNRALIKNTPMILLGETGCGKTYQINFMLEILLRVPKENIVRETLNAGTKISKLVDVLNTTVKRARSALGKGQDYWIFLDEFNTSDFQTFLSELMNDRRSM